MMRRIGVGIVRALVLAFCWMTATYAFIASSAFAYLQFIKPRVFHWVGTFSDSHWAVSWIWLALLGVLLWRPFRERGATGRAARTLFALSAAGVVVNTVSPVLPGLHAEGRSVVVGVLALVPVLWVGLLDHMLAWSWVAGLDGVTNEREQQRQEGRLLTSCVGTALLLTAGYSAIASVSVARSFEPDLLSAGLALGVASSLLGHLLVFCAVFVVLAVAARIGGGSIVRQYLLLLTMATLLFAGLFARFVGSAVGLVNAPAAVAALASGASIAAAWGGMKLSGHASARRGLATGLDVFLAPPPGDVPWHRGMVALLGVLPLAWGFILLAGRIDWDFALLKSGVVAAWTITFALVYRAAPPRHVRTLVVAVICGVPPAVHLAWQPGRSQQHTLERYAVHNPSFLLADGLLRERQRSSSFDRYLRAHTGLTDVSVQPVSIDVVPALTQVAPARRPPVFLLVIDSLRTDYLSPYNPEVRFTPRIEAFAGENSFFPNAYTQYAGTGLSMPAIWAGSALAHKQYVLPFNSMNALQKLLDVNGYRRMQTHDHITQALWADLDGDSELDRGRAEMDFDFCATVDELGRALDAGAAREAPIFAQTRSLNLHVAAVRNGYVPPGKSYRGFEPPYAYRVERIDGCFGAFIDRLKRLGLYDRSVVVLTSDHGELLGEDGRWGHSYHMFPQVIQVPLFVHLPASMEQTISDPGAVTLSTDITPTLYEVLGYRAASSSGALAGHSLIGSIAESAARRRGSVVLAASYGAVYAAVSRNGRRLYIADAIHEREHAYERASLTDLQWSEVPADEGMRMMGQLRIRRHIAEVAGAYGIDRSF